jgi:DNA repair exonuclease SbcCD ATPase subunit
MTDVIIEENKPQEEIVIEKVEEIVPDMGADETTLAEDLYEKELQAKREQMLKEAEAQLEKDKEIFEEKVEEKEAEHQEAQEEIKEQLEEVTDQDDDNKVIKDLTSMVSVLADKIKEFQKKELEFDEQTMKYEHQIKKLDMEVELLRKDNEELTKENVTIRSTSGKIKVNDTVMYFSQLSEKLEKDPNDKKALEAMADFGLNIVNYSYPELNVLDEKRRYNDMRKSAMLASTAGSGTSHSRNVFEDNKPKIPAGFVPVKTR